ncbi:MAG: hypothetical protein H6739_26085 [Alphaproteobacteria bacterium]|nr:hypothetical protein [Alphaproteobacteria bacterium]
MGVPERLLSRVLWACDSTRWPDRAAFDAAVRQYHLDIVKSDERWTPDAVAVRAPVVRVGFMCWTDDDQQIEPVLTLKADDGQAFTNLELLHKVCDGIAAYLVEHKCALYDHHFFEGLGLHQGAGEPPLYHVWFGS